MSPKPLTRREGAAIRELSAFLHGVFRSKPEAIERVAKLREALNSALYPGEAEPDEKSWEAADRLANRLLGSYTTMPVLSRDDEGYGTIEQVVVVPPDQDLDTNEARAVRQVIYLANQGILHQLIFCGNCETLFLPTRSLQKNCGADCSKQAYANGPEFRAKRNAWAREHYRSTKERDALNLKVLRTLSNKSTKQTS